MVVLGEEMACYTTYWRLFGIVRGMVVGDFLGGNQSVFEIGEEASRVLSYHICLKGL